MNISSIVRFVFKVDPKTLFNAWMICLIFLHLSDLCQEYFLKFGNKDIEDETCNHNNDNDVKLRTIRGDITSYYWYVDSESKRNSSMNESSQKNNTYFVHIQPPVFFFCEQPS